MNRTLLSLLALPLLMFIAPTFANAAVDISSVTVSAIKTTSVVISWDSTVAGTGQIEYGTTPSYGSITTEESLSYFHVIEASGLAEGTQYHFRIRAKEYGGAETVSGDYTFTTRTQAELNNIIQTARESQGGSGLPKIYYVSTTGNNAWDGLTSTSAWQSPAIAVSRAYAGDTVYLMDGTWTDEHIIFPRSGIDVAPITLTAYNGTPTLDGVDTTGDALHMSNGVYMNQIHHIVINGLKMIRYNSFIGSYNFDGWNNVIISNNDIGYGAMAVNIGRGSHHITVKNNIFHDFTINLNVVQIRGTEQELGSALDNIPSDHIAFKNNTFIHNHAHTGGIDVVGHMDYIDITGNTFNDVSGTFFAHGTPVTLGMLRRINFSYNTVINSGRVQLNFLWQSLVAYNDVTGPDNDPAMYIYSYSGSSIAAIDTTFLENTVRNNNLSMPIFRLGASTTDGTGRGNLYLVNNHHLDNASYFLESNNTFGTLRFTQWTNSFNVGAGYLAKVTTEFTDGIVFSIGITQSRSHTLIPPIWYPDKSNFTLEALEDASSSYKVTAYSMTARPSVSTATINVNSFNTTQAMGNVLVDYTANTDNGNNVDFVIGDLKAVTNYLIKRDTLNYHVVQSNANKCIKFSNSEWSQRNFTIQETALPADIITPPEVAIGYTTPPVSPFNLSAAAGNNKISLQWGAPLNNGGAEITNYRIYRGNTTGGETLLTEIGNTLSYTDTNVTNGTRYYYQVSALNSAGEGAKSNEVSSMPYAPSNPRTNDASPYAFPVPYVKGKNTILTFSNLLPSSKIEIYSVDGAIVYEKEVNEYSYSFVPDGFASGVYVYMIKNSKRTDLGKIVIIK